MTQELTHRTKSDVQQNNTQQNNKSCVSIKSELTKPIDQRVQQLNKVDSLGLFTQISAIITMFCKSLNVNINMRPEQITVLAKELITDCPDWTVDDFTLFFRGCSKGQFGEIKFSIDQPKIYEMKAQYEEQRSIEREKIVSQRKANYVEQVNEVDPEIMKQIYAKLERKREIKIEPHKSLKEKFAEYCKNDPVKAVEYIGFEVLSYHGGYVPNPDRYGINTDLVKRIQTYFIPKQGQPEKKIPAFFTEAISYYDKETKTRKYHPEIIEFAKEINQ